MLDYDHKARLALARERQEQLIREAQLANLARPAKAGGRIGRCHRLRRIRIRLRSRLRPATDLS